MVDRSPWGRKKGSDRCSGAVCLIVSALQMYAYCKTSTSSKALPSAIGAFPVPELGRLSSKKKVESPCISKYHTFCMGSYILYGEMKVESAKTLIHFVWAHTFCMGK